MKTDTTRWPEHHVEALKILAPTGLSRTQIAKQLNAAFPGATYTRNAVLSKISRLRLGMSASAASETNALSNSLRGKPPLGVANNCQVFERAPDAQPFRSAFKDPPGLCTPETLGPHMCKWPIGDPRDHDFTFCGRKTDRTYCEAHHARAYEPSTPNQKKADKKLAAFLRRHAA